jgi:hypothetical protein
MIFCRIGDMNGQGSNMMWLQLLVTLGTDNTAADCYINPNSSIAVQHATIADAARQALRAISLTIAEDAPVRTFTPIVEIG